MRLETVEDFENIAKALTNPRSQDFQYRIRSFGYCTFCDEITEYTGDYDIEGSSETCLKCRRDFGSKGHLQFHPSSQYLSGKDIPQRFRAEIQELHSREKQREFFNTMLKEFLRSKKSTARSAKKAVQRLAKLRIA